MLFRRLIWLALGIALLVGSLQSAVQQWQAMPIIRSAERFEADKFVASPKHAEHGAAGHAQHAVKAEDWKPRDGVERQAWTWIANVLLAFGLSLLMLVVLGAWIARHGAPAHPLRAGLLAALAGFVSIYLWPSLGLPAEIPGMDAARLGSRQGWWLLAAGCAAAAAASVAWSQRGWRWPVAAALLALPFLVGAPHVATDPFAGFSVEAATQLRELSRQFVQATAVVSAIQWLALGLACGYATGRWLLPLLTGRPVDATPDGAAAKTSARASG